jgi:hypothetical protein
LAPFYIPSPSHPIGKIVCPPKALELSSDLSVGSCGASGQCHKIINKDIHKCSGFCSLAL